MRTIPTQKIRSFIALAFDPSILMDLLHIQQALQACSDLPKTTRWIPPENWHLTFHFLGQVPVSLIEPLRNKLRDEFSGQTPLQLTLDHWAGFPTLHRCRVAGPGAKVVPSEIKVIHAATGKALESLGLSLEKRAFYPHISMVRFREAIHCPTETSKLPTPNLRISIRKITLFRSHLDTQNARYEPIDEIPLAQ